MSQQAGKLSARGETENLLQIDFVDLGRTLRV